MFVAWPTTYTWSPKCTSTVFTETVSGNPQPSNSPDYIPAGMYITEEELEADPEGMSWFMASAFNGFWPWGTMSSVWPNQPILTTCVDNDIGPNWAAFTSTNWYTATSTRYTSTTSTPGIAQETSSSSSTGVLKTSSTSQTSEPGSITTVRILFFFPFFSSVCLGLVDLPYYEIINC